MYGKIHHDVKLGVNIMKHIVKIIVAMLIWGSIGVFVKYINLPSVELVFLRALIASGALLAARFFMFERIKLGEIKKRPSREFLILAGTGIILAANWLLLFQAYKYTTLTNATLSYYLAPVFVILFSPIFFKEKITLRSILAIIAAMVGLALIVSQKAQSSGVNYNHALGILFGTMAAVLYACVVLVNKSVKGFSGFDKALIQIFVSALLLLPIVIYRGSLHIPDFKTLAIILILGIVHTAVSYVLYFGSIEHVKAQRVSLLSYIDPLSAVVFGTLILGEPIGIYHIIGGALILSSTLINRK
jgi:drug/metabolite transporter (DMT)-like permease